MDCFYYRITNYNNVETGFYRWTGCTDIISVSPVEPLQTSYVCAKDLYVEDYAAPLDNNQDSRIKSPIPEHKTLPFAKVK